MTALFNADNLLVRASLEAILAQNAHRLDADARHNRTLAAALMECAENGYPKLTIAQIAKRAKVSTATIYQDYNGRDALLVAAIEMLLEILAGDVIAIPETQNPVLKIYQLLSAHGHAYAEPLSTWMFRLYATLAWSGYPHLHELGHRIFKRIDGFWAGLLTSLVQAGHLVDLDEGLVTALLLGPIERATIMPRLLFGNRAGARLSLEDVARHSTQMLFSNWGSDTFWASPYAKSLSHEAFPVPAPHTGSNPPSLNTKTVKLGKAVDGDLASNRKKIARIVKSAAQECQERGYNDASMLEIAARAHVSSATIYKMFGDKETLLSFALEETMRLQEKDLDKQIKASPSLGSALSHIAARTNAAERNWAYNVMMASEISGSNKAVAIAEHCWAHLETSFEALLDRLNPDLKFSLKGKQLLINFLLGGIERTGVLTMVLFGQHNVDQHRLKAVVQATSVARLTPKDLIPNAA